MMAASFNPRALTPKPRVRSRFVPVLPEGSLGALIQRLTPHERLAMRWIVENADMLIVGGDPYILAPVTPAVMDALAAFEADMEDRENDLCDEEESDDDRENDNPADPDALVRHRPDNMPDEGEEPDCPEVRVRFADERRRARWRAA